jgi:hypothetical protein
MVSEAQEMARCVLAEALPRRWEHEQGVAVKAHRVAASLALSPEVLVSAAWLAGVRLGTARVTHPGCIPSRTSPASSWIAIGGHIFAHQNRKRAVTI